MTPLDLALQAITPYLSPADRAALQEHFAAYLGKPNHPVLIGNQFADLAARAAFPELTLSEARRRLARLGMAVYNQSILGRVMAAPLRFMGFDRILRQMPKQYEAASNYGTRWVAELGPRHWRLDCEDEILFPEMMIGNLEGIAEMATVSDLRVKFTLLAPRHYSYDITWGGT